MPDDVPTNGWDSPGEEPPDDADALSQIVRALLEVIPPDVQARMLDAVRDLLQALRALIDWWISRLECRSAGGGPPEVRDIPVL
jgi:hypothetical protein